MEDDDDEDDDDEEELMVEAGERDEQLGMPFVASPMAAVSFLSGNVCQ